MMKLLVISLLFSLASTEEGKVTCIAPSAPVEEGKNISITCHFPFDVSQENYMSVDVYLQPKNSDTEPIVSCLRLNAETLDCTTEKGYSIEGEVKTSLKLHIMNISAKHNGHVFCQVMPQYGDMPDVEICSLSVHGMSDLSKTTETAASANMDGKVTCIAPSTPVEEGKDISITFHFPFDVSQENYMSVDVYRQSKNSDREPVVSCLRLNAESLNCTTEKGYSIEGEVKTSLKLHIMNISAKHNGHVFCQVMPQHGDMPDVEFCSLSVHDGAGDDESDVGLHIGVGVGGILVMVIIIIVVYRCWYRNRKRKKKPDVENSCFNMDQIRARNRRPQEENSRDDGEVEELMPPEENVQHDDGELETPLLPMKINQEDGTDVIPMGTAFRDDGEVETPLLPMENIQQDSEQMLRKRHKANFNVHVPYSDRAELNNPMTSMENVQQADTEVIGNGTAIGDGRVVVIPMFFMRYVLRYALAATLWMFKYSKMSQWLQWSEVEATK